MRSGCVESISTITGGPAGAAGPDGRPASQTAGTTIPTTAAATSAIQPRRLVNGPAAGGSEAARADPTVSIGPAAQGALLGRHVLDRPEDRSLRGEGREPGLRLARRGRDDRLRLGETEVEQLRSARREHNVRGLEIAMRESLTVGAIQRVADFNG